VSLSTIFPDVYGWIDHSGPTAHDQSGTTGHCYVFKSGLNDVYRAYSSFDTSAIPTNCSVQTATIRAFMHSVNMPVGIVMISLGVQVWYEHDKIGGSIDTSDWGHSNFAGYKYIGACPLSFPCSFSIVVVPASVNPGGDSDYEFRDASEWTTTADGPVSCYHAKYGPASPNVMWLTVKWRAPLRFFNRFNLTLPRLPGFSNVLSAVWLPNGSIEVTQRFPARVKMVGV